MKLDINIVSILMLIYQVKGRSGLQRALTVPESAVRKLASRTHDKNSDVTLEEHIAKAIEERNEWAEEGVEFFDALLDADFEDLDEE